MYKRTSPLKQFATPVDNKQATTTVPEQPSAGMVSTPQPNAQAGYLPADNGSINKVNTPLMQRSKIFKK